MTDHPQQREMWEGLTNMGCLGIMSLIVLVAFIGVLFE